MPKFNHPNSGEQVVGLSTANSGAKKPGMDVATQYDDRQQAKAVERRMAPERIYQSRCSVCNHPFRDWVELMLVRGMQYKTLADRVSPPLSRHAISNHHKEHMDLQDQAFRQIIETEAELQGTIHDEGVADLVTKRAVLEIAMRKGFEDILNDVTTVEPRDLIQISKVLADMDSHQYEVGLDELRSQVQLFIQAIKDVCDPETQGAIGLRVKELRKREGIIGAFEEEMTSPPPVKLITEATVVEDQT
jgi:hypothetical protein